MTGRISMDVEALRDAIVELDRFLRCAREGWPRVERAAARARLSSYRTAVELDQHLDAVEILRDDLRARVDLMEAVNADGPGRIVSAMVGVATMSMPHGDSIEQVRTQLGLGLAGIASRLRSGDGPAAQVLAERLAPYADDKQVMGALFAQTGPVSLVRVMSTAATIPGPGLRLLELLTHGLHTADAGWPPARRVTFATGLVEAGVGTDHPVPDGAAVLAFLLDDSKFSTEFLDAAAVGVDAVERSLPVSSRPRWDLGSGLGADWPVKDRPAITGDPVEALMTALGKNPASAFTFFAGADRDQRVQHYLGARAWADDLSAVAAAVDVAATAFDTLGDPRADACALLAAVAVRQFVGHPSLAGSALQSVQHLVAAHVDTPAGLRNLPAALQVFGLGDDPTWVAQWWAGLSPGTREVALAGHGPLLGNLDGLPASARDLANRAVLGESLTDARADVDRLEREMSELTATRPQRVSAGSPIVAMGAALDLAHRRVAMLEAVDRQLNVKRASAASLYVLDDSQLPGRAAIGFGDLDIAQHIAVLVPGMSSYVTNYMAPISDNAVRVADLANQALAGAGEPGNAATLAWIGYVAPELDVVSPHRANVGQPLLSATLWGLQASHEATGTDPHLSVLGHSYGSFLSGLTATKDNPIDDLVLFGSPGAAVDSADDLHVPAGHVFVGEAEDDFVADLDRFGPDPARMPGVTTFQTDGGYHPLAGADTHAASGHSEYYLANSESLWNIVAVTTGRSDTLTTGFTPGRGDLIRDDVRATLGF